MRAVLDTNVLVRATKYATGPAGELLRRFERREYVLVLSKSILDELRAVLEYPRVAAIHRLSSEEVGEFLGGLERNAEMVELPEDRGLQTVTSDVKDVPILQTAVVGQVQVLCTRDRHLYEPMALAYCRSHGMEVMDDIALLALLRKSEDESRRS